MSTFDFTLPDVGEGIAEAEIIEWSVAVGDTVTVDQVVAVIETDKSQIEMPTPVAGKISAIHAKPGDVVKVGTNLISIETDGVVPSTSKSHSRNTPTANTSSTPSIASSTNSVGRPLASPSTRRLAATMGIDLGQVQGTGPHGRITESDVRGFTGEAIVNAPAPSIAIGTTGTRVIPLQGLRRQIANSMSQALSIPHIMEFKEIDATALLAFRDEVNTSGYKLSVTPFLMRAVINSLKSHPTFNARFDAGANEIHEFDAVHLGIATSTDDGLIVPVLKNASDLTIIELSDRLNELADLARTRKATTDQLTGGTFSLTNFGSFGTWLGTPVIRPPEVGIAGFGRVSEKVIVVDGQPAVRKVLPIVVAADHRINDGAHLGAFVSEIAQQLLNPQNLEK